MLGLGLSIPQVGVRRKASLPDDGVRDLIVVVGDSNGRGLADDQGSLVYSQDAGIVTRNAAGSFVEYTPGVMTGMTGGVDTTYVGPEMQLARKLRIASPSKTVYILKNAVAGSIQNAPNTTEQSWHPSSGTLLAQTKGFFDSAKAALVALGYTVRTTIIVSLGINDTATTVANWRYTYTPVSRAMFAEIEANWGLAVGDKIIQLRVTSDNSGCVPIRAGQQDTAKADAKVYLLDTDASGKSADVTHYNIAGQIANGNGCYDIVSGASTGLDLNLIDEDFSTNNRAWTTGAATVAVTGGQLVFTSTPAFGSSTITAYPFEAGASYEITYTITSVTSGSVRLQLTGGTATTGTTRTTPGTYTQTVVAQTGNITFGFNAAGSGFTGAIDNVTVRKV